MKRIVLLLSLGLVMGGYAFAAEHTALLTTGSVGADIGVRSLSNTDDDSESSHNAFALNGKFSLPLWHSFSLQLDGDYESYDAGEDQVEYQKALGLHASYRNPDRFLVGLFGGYGKGKTDEFDAVSGEYYGVEAQYYLSRVTFYGQYGDADVDNFSDDDNSFDGKFFTLAVRYFPTDDILLQLGFEQGKSPDGFEDQGNSQWGKVKLYSLAAEMRLPQSLPLYGVAKITHGTYVANTEDDGSDTAMMVGLKYYFGAPSLFANDRRGATLSTSLLPSRGASWAGALD